MKLGSIKPGQIWVWSNGLRRETYLLLRIESQEKSQAWYLEGNKVFDIAISRFDNFNWKRIA